MKAIALLMFSVALTGCSKPKPCASIYDHTPTLLATHSDCFMYGSATFPRKDDKTKADVVDSYMCKDGFFLIDTVRDWNPDTLDVFPPKQ